MLNVHCFDKNTINTALKTWNRNAKVETTTCHKFLSNATPLLVCVCHHRLIIPPRYYHQSMMTCSLPSRPGSNKSCGVTRKRRELTTLCATGTVLVTEYGRHFHFCRLVSHATRASSPVSARPLARIAVQLTCPGRRT